MITPEQWAAQAAEPPKQPLSVEGCWAKTILDRVKAAESLTQPGTYEHGKYLGVALAAEWPRIRPLLEKMVR